MPEDEAGAGFVLNAEEVQLGAELAMIATLGFLQAMEVFVQLFFGEEAGGVNALQLRISFLTFPVRAGDAHQLEGLNTFGGRNVRAPAAVDELAGGIGGYDRL